MQKHKLTWAFFSKITNTALCLLFWCAKEQGTTSNDQNSIWLPFDTIIIIIKFETKINLYLKFEWKPK